MRVFILIAALLLSACTQKAPTFRFIHDVDGIFSTRPQGSTHSLLLLKLQNPPLLKELISSDGKRSVDAALAKAIEEEQGAVIKELEKISADIKVLYRYRMVINGIAIVTPTALKEKISEVANIAYFEASGNFSRPKVVAMSPLGDEAKNTLRERNSTKFIGADQAHAKNIRGQGVKVGIIDTGIDYTHAMFGGTGTEEAFKAVDPAQSASGFPNAKVVAGIDLVGTKYNSESGDFRNRVPRVDANPIDEAGHGTHVAGTVSGIGDGENTIDGVAPDAALHAIKVFGKDGSTGDAVVIAALEYSADPNTDADVSDRLDVVNLSLGSGYGEGHVLYTEAIMNLTTGGTVVVASAGNSGDSSYNVGAPGVAADALSVAASVDDMDDNWKFRAVRFTTTQEPEIVIEAIESTMTKPIEESGTVNGPLVHLGLADKDLSDEQKAILTGKIALIDRGVVTFAEKIKRASEAGAIGVVVINNNSDAPFTMGGEGEFKIPAIMIAKDLGEKLKASPGASIEFNTGIKIQKPELIDTIAGFSSKGPRSYDALVKPEISAPGQQVISAAVGGGKKGVAMSGTSMASPQMAGVIALLKQTHPTLSALELKALAMATAKSIVDEKKKLYSVSRQGAGRVQVMKALEGRAIALPSAVSLGEMTIEKKKVLARSISLKNISSEALTLSVAFEGSSNIKMFSSSTVSVEAGKSINLEMKFSVDAFGLENGSTEMDGLILFKNGDQEVVRVPVLAVANKVSQINGESLVIRSTSEADSAGALVELVLANTGIHAGNVFAFNLIGSDPRKEDPTNDEMRSKSCDLRESGYRVIRKKGVLTLQVAVKLFEPVSTWDGCEVSVLIDSNGDKVADQELLGAKADHLKGIPNEVFASLLLDANVARELRKKFEAESQAGKEDPKEDYSTAIINAGEFLAIPHSTISIVEAPVAALGLRPTGELSVQIATSYQEASAIEGDDFLGDGAWMNLNASENGAAFVGMSEVIGTKAGEKTTVAMTKGAGSEKLILLFPSNKPVIGGLDLDRQSQVVESRYEVDVLSGL